MKIFAFLKQHNVLKSNKGAVIEMVIFAALISFSLCTLLMIYTFKAKDMGYFSANVTEERLEIDSIGEDYIKSLNDNSKFNVDNYYYMIKEEKFYYRFEFENQFIDENKYMKVYDRRNLVLRVDCKYDENLDKYIVIGWVYGE